MDRWLSLVAIAMGVVFFLLPKTPPIIIAALLIIGALLLHPLWNFWWIEDRRWRQCLALTVLVALLGGLGIWIWPANLVLILHDVYPESWGGRIGGPPLDLEASSPLLVRVGVFHRVDPCVMPPMSVSNIDITLTFPAELQVDESKMKRWQKWPGQDGIRYLAHFGNLDPNPSDCSVIDELFQFKALRAGQFPVKYQVTGRSEKLGAINPIPRTVMIEAK